MRPAHALPTRVAIVTIFFHLTTLFALPAATLHSKLFVLCKRPNSFTCVAWPLRLDNAADDPKQYYLSGGLKCIVSTLQNTPTPGRFATVKFSDRRRTEILCRALYIKTIDASVDLLGARGKRVRRANGYPPKGRYRGQTQSQYLSIDHGNKKDEGKAEAHSAADSSRAVVSGNSGMGQAQSQTVFDPSCEDCLSRSELDAANISYKPGQSINTGSNTPGGISQPVHGISTNNGVPYQYVTPNGHFKQPGGTNSEQSQQNQLLRGILTGALNTPGVIDTSGQPATNPLVSRTTIPGGNLFQPGNIQPNQSPDGSFVSSGQMLPPGNIITATQNLPDRNGIISQQPGSSGRIQTTIPGNSVANNPLQQSGQIPSVSGFNTFNPSTTGIGQPGAPGNIFTQPGNLMTNRPVGPYDSNRFIPPHDGLNTNSGNIPLTSISIPSGQGNILTNTPASPGSNLVGTPTTGFLNNRPMNSNIPQNLLGDNLKNVISGSNLQPGTNGHGNMPIIGQGTGPNWSLLSSLLPGTGSGSTYFCCVVSPGNSPISQGQSGQNNNFLGHSYNPGVNGLPQNGYGAGQLNTGQNTLPNVQSTGSVSTSQPGIIPQNVPYTGQPSLSNLGQQFVPNHNLYNTGYSEPNGAFNVNSNTGQPGTNGGQYGGNIPTGQYGQTPTDNVQYTIGQNGLQNPEALGNIPYVPGNTGQNNIQTPSGSYNNRNLGTNGPYSPGGPFQNAPSAYEIRNNGLYGPASITRSTVPSNTLYGNSIIGQTPYGSENSHSTSNGPYGQIGKGQAYPENVGLGSSGANSPEQNKIPAANFPYSAGSTNNPRQNILPSTNIPFGTGSIGSNAPGQNILPSSNIPYGAVNIGTNAPDQNPLHSSNMPYGVGKIGTNIPGQNLLPSSNMPFGTGITGANTPEQNMLTSAITPYGPGETGTNTAFGPVLSHQNTPYTPGNLGPNSISYPNGYGIEGNDKNSMQYPNRNYEQNNLQYPNRYAGMAIPGQNNLLIPNGSTNYQQPNGYNQQSGNNNGAYGFNGQQLPGVDNGNGGISQNVSDSSSITSSIGDYDSEAQASVSQAVNGTTAVASSKGGNEKGRAQTQVEGTYSGTGSFSANAEISDDNKAAQSHVSGDKKGASSSAEGRGRKNKSQASVKLGSETGSIITDSQSSGDMHSSTSQVQGSVKGGMADAQAKGPGSTSSQAQIGFTPFKESDKKAHDSLKTPFEGAGTSSAQTSGRLGTSQSQLHGMFKYGITYNGAAQSGSSVDKDAVFSNLLPFDKIDVFDENNKNINVDNITTEDSGAITSSTDSYDETTRMNQDSNIDNKLLEHTHSDHHKSDSQQNKTTTPLLEGNRRSFQPNYSTNGADYEYGTDKEDNQQDYDIDDGYGTENGQEHNEYTNYDDINRDTEATHQSLKTSNHKGLDVQQSTGGNTQHIILGSLNNHDAKIVQRNSEHPDESKVYQPGERVPGMGGYAIPVGFTGSVKSVASKDKTYVVGSKSSPSQAQTVTLTPGTGKVKYVYPYNRNVNAKDLRSLYNPKPDDNRYMSVSKSITRDLDNENNIRRQYSHTYYTKSSSCGYFTFTCTIVSSSEGKKKVCKPKMPTNPDGSPMRC